MYKEKAKELGFDECHLYIRAISFEFAQKKPDAETKPISTTKLIENDSFVDRLSFVDIIMICHYTVMEYFFI